MATATATKRVGGAKKGTESPDKEKKQKGRSIYDYKKLVDANGAPVVNEKGLLVTMPPELKAADGTVTQHSFNFKTNKPLKKSDFGDDATFLRYRADGIQFRVDRMQELATVLRTRADNLGKYGDEKKRKKAAKLERMRTMMAQLEKELAEDDVEADGE